MGEAVRPSVVLGAVGTIRGKARYSYPCLVEVGAAASKLVDEIGLLHGAPFSWIGIVITFGETRTKPVLRVPNRTYGDLPVSVAVPMSEVMRVSRETTCDVIARAVADCLVAAARKHRLGSAADLEKLAAFTLRARQS